MKQTFSIREAFKTGWEVFKGNIGLSVGVIFIFFIIQAISQMAQMLFGIHLIAGIIGSILVAILGLVIAMGMIHVFIGMYDTKEVGIGDLFSQTGKLWKYIGVSLVASFVIIGGMLLLVIPGIIASIALMFALLLVIDRNMGVLESLKTSWVITKGHRWKLLFFILTAVILNIIGAILLLVGLFVTLPVTYFAGTHVYRTLLAQAEGNGLFPVDKLQTAQKVFIAVGVIGLLIVPLLSAILLSSMNSAREKVRDARRMADVKSIQLGAEMYYDENGGYPISVDQMEGDFLFKVPVDPDTRKSYTYQAGDDTKSYEICVAFEAREDACFTQGF